MTRPSTEITVLKSKVGLFAQVFFGLAIMAGGAYTFWVGLNTENHTYMIWGAITAVGGGLVLPSVFSAAQPVIVFIIERVPFFGGRRATDIQPPAPFDFVGKDKGDETGG